MASESEHARVAKVPESLFDEFAIASSTDIEELEKATLALTRKGFPTPEIVRRLVKAGWSESAASWYAGEVAKGVGLIRISIEESRSFAQYPREAELEVDGPGPMLGARIVGGLDALIGLLVALGVASRILLMIRFPQVRLSTTPLFISAFSAGLLLTSSFLLFTVNSRRPQAWLRAAHVVEWLNVAAAVLSIYRFVVAITVVGWIEVGSRNALLLAYPITWFSLRGLRLYCESVRNGKA
ncbi:MAG TPA: hypothetical protein VHE55_18060 [Fimbriimonadaceae bacterium]|nr:hypothetical protein [Fimbriimonadaceae bacterium]